MAHAVPYSPLASSELPSRSRITPGVPPAWTLFLLPIYIDKLNCLLNKPQHTQLSGKSGTPAMRSYTVQKPQPLRFAGLEAEATSSLHSSQLLPLQGHQMCSLPIILLT